MLVMIVGIILGVAVASQGIVVLERSVFYKSNPMAALGVLLIALGILVGAACTVGVQLC